MVESSKGTSWAELAAILRAELRLSPGSQLSAEDGRDIDPAATVGTWPLLDGLLLAVTPAATVSGRCELAPTVVSLEVSSGPDAGHVVFLPAGDHVLGRSPYADVRVLDPGLSRRHAVLSVAADGLRVHDLGSANGTSVEGSPVGPAWVAVPPGAALEAGGSLFRLVPPSSVHAVDAAERSAGPDGLVRIETVPTMLTDQPNAQSAASLAPTTIRFPQRPASALTHRGLLLTAVVPIVMACGLSVALRNWLYLAIGLLGPLTLLAQGVADRRAGRGGRAVAVRAYDAAMATAQDDLCAALRRERAARHLAHPPLPAVLATAAGQQGRLWQEAADNDRWSARVGCGAVVAHVTVVRPEETEPPKQPNNPNCPLTVSLLGRAVALCGSPDELAGLARSILIQLATAHPPNRTRLRLSAEAARLVGPDWLEWLPHLRAETAAADSLRDVVIITSGAKHTPSRRPLLTRAVVVLVPDSRTGADPPSWCDVIVRLRGGGVTVGSAPASAASGVATPAMTGRAELLRLEPAAAAARALAPLRPHDEPASSTDPSVGLLAALNLPEDEATLIARLRQHWSTQDAQGHAKVHLGEVVDRADGGPCEIDLDRDGPHVLLAGMTGSGKSELLQTLVAGLVLHHRPEDLALVLLDYKGGSAFAPFAKLPHTVGVLTDLDPETTARALRALGAELRHREARLRDAGVVDAAGYQAFRRRHPQAEPMPRLIVVIDEYRVLAEDHAPLMSALVRIAGLGRGLGLHLVLATQRPGGIVSAEIRANVNARIALRVRDALESQDVIETAEAARLDPHTPGRGYLRVGSRPPVAFQAVRVGAAVRRERTGGPRVTRRSSPGPPPDRPQPVTVGPRAAGSAPTSPGEGPRVVDVIVAAAEAAAQRDGHRRPPSIWAPPLPTHLRISACDQHEPADPEGLQKNHQAGLATFPSTWTYGLVDDPDGRRVDPLVWRPHRDGHLALVGTGRTGRTGAVLALLTGLSTACPNRTHVHVIDAVGSLGTTADLPHCAGLVGLDDLGAVRRLIDRLHADQPADQDPTMLILVIHGWEQLCAALDGMDHGRGTARLMELLRSGRSHGVHVVLTGDRGLLTGAVASCVEHKVVLRLADSRDALLAGVRLPVAAGPGRGVHLPSGRIVQLASAGADEISQAGSVARGAHADCAPPIRLTCLPHHLRLDDVPGDERRDRLAIGVAEDGSPAWVDPGATLLVAGPAGSGRSTALRVIAVRAADRGLSVQVVMGRQRWSPDLPGSSAGLIHLVSAQECIDLLNVSAPPTGVAKPLVLIDDLDELPEALCERLDDLAAHGHTLVVSVRTAFAVASYTGVVGRLRRGDALILSATPSDGQLLGITLGYPQPPLPGRACLVRRGQVRIVQVAQPAAVAAIERNPAQSAGSIPGVTDPCAG